MKTQNCGVGVCSTSENKDKAFEAIAQVLTDPVLNDLLVFNYDPNDEDATEKQHNYQNAHIQFGNCLIHRSIITGDEDAEALKNAFELTEPFADIDFTFDSTELYDLDNALLDVILYKTKIPDKTAEFDDYLDGLKKQFEELGIQKLIDEANRQYEDYLNEKSN